MRLLELPDGLREHCARAHAFGRTFEWVGRVGRGDDWQRAPSHFNGLDVRALRSYGAFPSLACSCHIIWRRATQCNASGARERARRRTTSTESNHGRTWLRKRIDAGACVAAYCGVAMTSHDRRRVAAVSHSLLLIVYENGVRTSDLSFDGVCHCRHHRHHEHNRHSSRCLHCTYRCHYHREGAGLP